MTCAHEFKPREQLRFGNEKWCSRCQSWVLVEVQKETT